MATSFRALAALVFCSILAGCATSTLPGQIGVTRNQLLLVPTGQIDSLASESYAKATSVARSAGRLNNDDALTTRVRGIANRLIDQVGVYRPDAKNWNWQVNVIDSNELNAFCLPGGRIVIYSGLVKRLDLNDAEVAGVVGHEIAHALREHGREKMSQHVLSNAVVQGIANSGSKNAGAAAALTNIGSQLFLKLPFSRDMEIEADSMGLELAARAGYDPRQAANIWRKFQTQQGTGSSVEFLNTHPGWERRVVESEAALAKVASLYQPPPEAESTNPSRSKMVTPTHQLAAPREPGISSPAAVDSGGHSGFAPTCRWVTATVWSCK